MNFSFRFLNPELQHQFVALLNEAEVNYKLDRDGAVHYTEAEEQRIENEVLSRVRDSIFEEWQIISCPGEWAAEYKHYMTAQQVPYVEELIDGQLGFLIPRSYRPHAWKLRKPPR